jgi:hypothetical protein
MTQRYELRCPGKRGVGGGAAPKIPLSKARFGTLGSSVARNLRLLEYVLGRVAAEDKFLQHSLVGRIQ